MKIKRGTKKRWLVVAGRNTPEIIAQYDDVEAVYRKANENKKWLVQTRESYEKEFSQTE